MRSVDVPQIDDLSRVVQAVRAVAAGTGSSDEVGATIGLSVRHAIYALHAARILGFVTLNDDASWSVAPRGTDLVRRTGPEVLSALRDAVRSSTALDRIAPHLLSAAVVNEQGLARAIENHARLAPSTAIRRAKTLLAWRRRLTDAPTLFAEPDPPPFAAAARHDLFLRRLAIENYGPLRSVSAELGQCSVIIGRNATGKSTFLDAFSFISDALENGVEYAWRSRAEAWHDLLWYGRGDAFTLVLELDIPPGLRERQDRDTARYELRVGVLSSGAIGVQHEALYFTPQHKPKELVHTTTPKRWLRVLAQGGDRAAYFHAETGDWKTIFQLLPNQLALAHVQASEDRFPVTLKVRDLLSSGVTFLALSAEAMRRPCSPRLTGRLRRNGENLPLRVAELHENEPGRYRRWVQQVREALPDLKEIEVAERPDDRHRYLVVRYRDGLRVPAWRLSDGTLRILALTLVGFLDEDSLVLIEEPENGVHPRAVEAVYEALGSAPRTQALVATHSPVLLGIVPPSDLLCFAHDGAETRIISGAEHPVLRSWRNEVDLGTVFASGVLD